MTPTPWYAAPLRVIGAFFTWIRVTLDTLCDRPDHLQRLSIIGSGMAAYPLIGVIIAILVYFGLHGPDTSAALLVIPIIGALGYGAMALYALSQVALLGIIKGVRLTAPGGVNVEIETTSGDGRGLASHTTTTTKIATPGGGPPTVEVTDTGSGSGQISE